MFKYEISVTAEDIKHGIRKNCRMCPIALAIKREFPIGGVAVTGPSLKYARTRLDGSLLRMMFQLPRRCEKFVRDFDVALPVEPFTFTLESEKELS